ARGGGQPLAENVRAPMERAFGVGFGRVRVHTDANAVALNRSMRARAFTTEQDIFFKEGEYHPGCKEGRELIAHELAHVVQQNGKQTEQTTNFDINNLIGPSILLDSKDGDDVLQRTKISEVWKNAKQGEWEQSYHDDPDGKKKTRYVMLIIGEGWHISF